MVSLSSFPRDACSAISIMHPRRRPSSSTGIVTFLFFRCLCLFVVFVNVCRSSRSLTLLTSLFVNSHRYSWVLSGGLLLFLSAYFLFNELRKRPNLSLPLTFGNTLLILARIMRLRV